MPQLQSPPRKTHRDKPMVWPEDPFIRELESFDDDPQDDVDEEPDEVPDALIDPHWQEVGDDTDDDGTT